VPGSSWLISRPGGGGGGGPDQIPPVGRAHRSLWGELAARAAARDGSSRRGAPIISVRS
jgi:hypothetical protein